MAAKRAQKTGSKTSKRSAGRTARTAARSSRSGRTTRSSAGTRRAGKRVAGSKTSRPRKTQDAQPRPGFIAHTEFVSADPDATKRWLQDGIGLDFMPSMDMGAAGPYHMWNAGERTGGGIRGPAAGETPGAIPYIEVKSITAGFTKALKAGATEVMAPQQIGGGHGWMAIVKAPGGPLVGLWSNK